MKKRILPLLLLVMLALMAWRHAGEFPGLIEALERTSPAWLLVAVALQVMTYVSVGICYRVLAGSLRMSIPLGAATRMSVVNLFVNSAVPSAGLSGNFFLVKMLTARGVPAATAALIVLLERIVYFAALATFVGAFLAWTIMRTGAQVAGWHRELAALGGVVLLVAALALFARRALRKPARVIERVIAIRKRMPRWISKRIDTKALRADARRIEEAGGLAALPKKRIALAYAAELMLLACDAATVWVLFRALGSDLAPDRVALGYGLATLLAQTVLIPGALEVGLAGLLDGLGARTGTALLVAILFHFLSLWCAMPFGWIFWRNAIPRREGATPSS